MELAIVGWWSEIPYRGALGPDPGQTCVPFTPDQYGRGIGHATQIAWGETTKVGCAIGRCNPYQSYVVCRYSPP